MVSVILFALLYSISLKLNCHASPDHSDTQTKEWVSSHLRVLRPPIVINTWNFTKANTRAWQELSAKRSALDAVEMGCSQCEMDQCAGTVGYGGDPSETGEVTLDAMIMDGQTYDVGAVGGLRRVRQAISVARQVLERTDHTLLVGEMATQFALSMGFEENSLETETTRDMIAKWHDNKCQPNFWKNVVPDPKTSCGPYRRSDAPSGDGNKQPGSKLDQNLNTSSSLDRGHDTIGMIAIDSSGNVASGTSTNGLKFKIFGRVGDSPVPGSGCYAAKEAGAAAATGDGDVIMRFLLSYQAIENLRLGMSAQLAASDVIMRQVHRTSRPYSRAAVIVLSRDGQFGAACCGFVKFPFIVSDASLQFETHVIDCIQ